MCVCVSVRVWWDFLSDTEIDLCKAFDPETHHVNTLNTNGLFSVFLFSYYFLKPNKSTCKGALSVRKG